MVRSSVANSDANRCASSRRPLARSPSSPPSMAAFAAAIASAGPFANFAAIASAVGYTSAFGTTASTRPISSASSAFTNRPV